MKIEDVPLDGKYLKEDDIVRNVDYATDSEGKYHAVSSIGWEVKNDALELALDEVNERCQEILEKIKRGESSPLEYHAEKNLMPIDLLSDYSGFSKRTIRKHFDPLVFAKLDDETLSVYADVLRITVEELKSIPN
jgi:hypothetical protein